MSSSDLFLVVLILFHSSRTHTRTLLPGNLAARKFPIEIAIDMFLLTIFILFIYIYIFYSEMAVVINFIDRHINRYRSISISRARYTAALAHDAQLTRERNGAPAQIRQENKRIRIRTKIYHEHRFVGPGSRSYVCMITSSIQSRQSADSRSRRWRLGTAARRRPAHRWPPSTVRDARPAQTAPRSSGTAVNQSTLKGDVEIGCAIRDSSRWYKQSHD
jgi:hypothetical protein